MIEPQGGHLTRLLFARARSMNAPCLHLDKMKHQLHLKICNVLCYFWNLCYKLSESVSECLAPSSGKVGHVVLLKPIVIAGHVGGRRIYNLHEGV